MLNIVNNIPSIELGEHLQQFKEFTKELSPALRGDAISNFTFVKEIHNSFARSVKFKPPHPHMSVPNAGEDSLLRPCVLLCGSKSSQIGRRVAAHSKKSPNLLALVAFPRAFQLNIGLLDSLSTDSRCF